MNLTVFSHQRSGSFADLRASQQTPCCSTLPPSTFLSRASSGPLMDRQIFVMCSPLTFCCSCTKPRAPLKTHTNVLASALALKGNNSQRDNISVQPSDCRGIISFMSVSRRYHAIKQEGKVRSVHKAQPFPWKPSIECPAENPSSVHEPGSQARAALQTSSSL